MPRLALKKLLGVGGLRHLFLPSSKFDGQFSRHGVGVSSCFTNLSDKQASKQGVQQQQKNLSMCMSGQNQVATLVCN